MTGFACWNVCIVFIFRSAPFKPPHKQTASHLFGDHFRLRFLLFVLLLRRRGVFFALLGLQMEGRLQIISVRIVTAFTRENRSQHQRCQYPSSTSSNLLMHCLPIVIALVCCVVARRRLFRIGQIPSLGALAARLLGRFGWLRFRTLAGFTRELGCRQQRGSSRRDSARRRRRSFSGCYCLCAHRTHRDRHRVLILLQKPAAP